MSANDVKARFSRDKELEEYRSLMEAPEQFEEGFNIKTIIGVLFVALVMVPGSIYLDLMIGGSLGAAAQWVTIILFAEVAKRSFTTLRKQEVFMLFYVASATIAGGATFAGFLWNQYLVQSPAAEGFGIATLIPRWVAPQATSEAILKRTFLHRDWVPAIALTLTGVVLGRVAWFAMGYVLFRITSDVERLPFPLAPVNAQGAMALAESTTGEETWRWRAFSAGGMIGIAFGIIYVGIPGITGEVLTKQITLLPIPFLDMTHTTELFLPATPVGIALNIGIIFGAFYLPFWMVVGTFIGAMSSFIINPTLYHFGYLNHWRQGMDAITAFFANWVDFWMSFGVGMALAVASIGAYQLIKELRSLKERLGSFKMPPPPPGRGDFPIKWPLALFALVTIIIITISSFLIHGFPIYFFIIFGFIITPIESYISAMMAGLTSVPLSIPFVREATFILSGYRGVDIWFAPMPYANYGGYAQMFRTVELTGTKFSSIIKAELFMVPVIIFTSFLYYSYIWKIAPVPSARYPNAEKFWPLWSLEQCLWITGTVTAKTEAEVDKTIWIPTPLVDRTLYYWRSRANDGKNNGPWSDTGSFYLDTGRRRTGEEREKGPTEEALMRIIKERAPEEAKPVLEKPVGGNKPPSSPVIISPQEGTTTKNQSPKLTVRNATDPDGNKLTYYFEIDTDPYFGSPLKQRSTDIPWLFRAFKPKVVVGAMIVGIVIYAILSFFGLPTLLIFGFIRSLGNIPHVVLPEIIGALLGRYYFSKKFGVQQWRQYALVLAVGFACGMGLIGMSVIAFVLISKSASVLAF